MKLHNRILLTGFVLCNIVALYYNTVPVWPIWWSQTGMYEHPFPSHFLFAMTAVGTAAAFLYVNDAHLYWRKSPANLLGCASVVCFAGMGIINSTTHPWVRIHGALAGLSGLCMAAFTALRVYEMSKLAPAPRSPRPIYEEPWVQVVICFAVMLVSEKLFKWVAVGSALGFDLNGTYSQFQAGFIRSSSGMQWCQLLYMGQLTEHVTFTR
jgi:hypothetical protein